MPFRVLPKPFKTASTASFPPKPNDKANARAVKIKAIKGCTFHLESIGLRFKRPTQIRINERKNYNLYL